jgi:hypothetical protein
MANYFPVALTGMARSWLMNLPEGTLDSWSELCYQFMTNFESIYDQPGNNTDLHAVEQRPEESLRSFIQWFSQVRNTIPLIFNASVVIAFHQGVRESRHWRSSPPTASRMSLCSSTWRTSALGLPRAVCDTPRLP